MQKKGRTAHVTRYRWHAFFVTLLLLVPLATPSALFADTTNTIAHTLVEHKATLRAILIAGDLPHATAYVSDLSRSGDEATRAFAHRYRRHLAKMYADIAGVLERRGSMRESIDARISAEALDPRYIPLHNAMKPRLVRTLTRFHLQRGDMENALYYYYNAKRALPVFIVPALEEAHRIRGSMLRMTQERFFALMQANVCDVTLSATYYNDKEAIEATNALFSAYLINTNTLLTAFPCARPPLPGRRVGDVSYTARFHDGGQATVRLHGMDAVYGFALLHVTEGLRVPTVPFAYVRGNHTLSSVGTALMQVRGPHADDVSPVEGEITREGRRIWQTGVWHETDLPIDTRAGGSPIFDRYHKLLGLTVVTEGRVHALPIGTIRFSFHTLEKGRTPHYGFLGILLSHAREETPGKGLHVRFVFPESPAYVAGVRPGDRLRTINHRRVEDAFVARESVIERMPRGVVALSLTRDENPLHLYVPLGTRPHETLHIEGRDVPPGELLTAYFGLTVEEGRRPHSYVIRNVASSSPLRNVEGVALGKAIEIPSVAYYCGRCILKVRVREEMHTFISETWQTLIL